MPGGRQIVNRNNAQSVNARNRVILAQHNNDALADGDEVRMRNRNALSAGEFQYKRFEAVLHAFADALKIHGSQ